MNSRRFPRTGRPLWQFRAALALCALWGSFAALPAAQSVEKPFRGVTHIARTETAPRDLHIHVVAIDLDAPGIAFKLTPPGGALETPVRRRS